MSMTSEQRHARRASRSAELIRELFEEDRTHALNVIARILTRNCSQRTLDQIARDLEADHARRVQWREQHGSSTDT